MSFEASANSGIVVGVTDHSQPERSAIWAMHAAGWCILWALYFFLDLPRASDVDLLTLFTRAGVWAAGGMLISLVLERVYAMVDLDDRSALAWLAAASIGSLIGAALWLGAFNALDWAVGLEPGFVSPLDWGLRNLLAEYMSFVFPLLAWQGATRSTRQALRTRKALDQALSAEREATEAKLLALRHQLNPHFLFNALNSAVELTRTDPAAAEQMLLDLSVLLRETLRAPTGTHALEDEVQLVRRYIAVEQRRFGERLHFELVMNAPPNTQVPALALHVLVENAVKHGMRGNPAPLEVLVQLDLTAEGLKIVAENTGSLMSIAEGLDSGLDNGLGLRNLRERLAVTYGGRHSFDLSDVAGEGDATSRVRACLELRGSPEP